MEESGNTSPSTGSSSDSGQTLKWILYGALLLGIMFLFVYAGGGCEAGYKDNIDVPKSTIAREPLPAGYVNETGYYTDELGWIINTGDMESGMKEFYKATGVQPYVYLTDNIDGNAISVHDLEEGQLADYAETLYNKLFTDEAHLLFLFYKDRNHIYNAYDYVCGSQAAAVIDSDAGEILLDYVYEYRYFDGDVGQYYGKVFRETADNIMPSKAPWYVWAWIAEFILIIPSIVIINILRIRRYKASSTGNPPASISMMPLLCGSMLFLMVCIFAVDDIMSSGMPWYFWAGILLIIPTTIIWNNHWDRKEEKAERQAGMLEIPLKGLGDAETETLIDKYLADMNRNLAEIKTATENVLEEEARTKKLVDENKNEIEKLKELAKTALLGGNEPEAKEFLEKKARFEAQEADLKAAYAAACANSKKMSQMCDKLTANIAELTSRREAIRVKKSIAKTQEAINTFSSNIDKAQGTEGAFALMEENADRMVDQVNAMLELNEEPVDQAEILGKKYLNIGTKSMKHRYNKKSN